jgi:predicted amidohydrolase
MLICLDGWFPELYRLAAMQGADIICVCTNWVPMKSQPEDQLSMSNILAMGNAHCNGLNVICADRCGVERGQQFIGQSLIVGYRGWILAGPASRDKKEILYADINIRETRRSRQWTSLTHILRDRRGDVHDPLLGSELPPAGWQF